MPAVAVEGLSKSFSLPTEKVHTLKERVLHPLRGRGTDRFTALDGVSFSVERGEFFGIVGRNGSGKSTLLKCLAGIYRADGGTAYIDGRLSTFIELGVGFNMDLPARDNIRINGVMLGLSTREARRREDEVLDFAGLRGFEDLKIKNYSSGMLVRLGFAIMAHVDADVLLIDEVLAVGDAAFQQKCFDQFAKIRKAGRTVLLVTHDMGAVERFCDRALLLEHGRITRTGEPHDVAMRYLAVNFADEADTLGGPGGADDGAAAGDAEPGEEHGADEEAEARYGDGRAEILEAWFEDAAGGRTNVLPHGEPCAFAARVRFRAEVEDPLFGVVLVNQLRHTAFSGSTLTTDPHTGRFAAGDEVLFRVRFDNIFAGGRYFATPAVAQGGTGVQWLDRRDDFVTVMITSSRSTDATVDIPYAIDLETRVRAPAPGERPADERVA